MHMSAPIGGIFYFIFQAGQHSFYFSKAIQNVVRVQGWVFGKCSDFSGSRINWAQPAFCKHLSNSLREIHIAFYPMKGSAVRTGHWGEIAHSLLFLTYSRISSITTFII